MTWFKDSRSLKLCGLIGRFHFHIQKFEINIPLLIDQMVGHYKSSPNSDI